MSRTSTWAGTGLPKFWPPWHESGPGRARLAGRRESVAQTARASTAVAVGEHGAGLVVGLAGLLEPVRALERGDCGLELGRALAVDLALVVAERLQPALDAVDLLDGVDVADLDDHGVAAVEKAHPRHLGVGRRPVVDPAVLVGLLAVRDVDVVDGQRVGREAHRLLALHEPHAERHGHAVALEGVALLG